MNTDIYIHAKSVVFDSNIVPPGVLTPIIRITETPALSPL